MEGVMFWKNGAGSPTKEEWNAMKKIVGFISEHKKLLIVLAVLAVAVVVWQVYCLLYTSPSPRDRG